MEKKKKRRKKEREKKIGGGPRDRAAATQPATDFSPTTDRARTALDYDQIDFTRRAPRATRSQVRRRGRPVLDVSTRGLA